MKNKHVDVNYKPELKKLTQDKIAKLKLIRANIFYSCDYYAIIMESAIEFKVYCADGYLPFTFTHLDIKENNKNNLVLFYQSNTKLLYVLSKYGIFNLNLGAERVTFWDNKQDAVMLSGFSKTYIFNIKTNSYNCLDKRYLTLRYLGKNKYALVDAMVARMTVLNEDMQILKPDISANSILYRKKGIMNKLF